MLVYVVKADFSEKEAFFESLAMVTVSNCNELPEKPPFPQEFKNRFLNEFNTVLLAENDLAFKRGNTIYSIASFSSLSTKRVRISLPPKFISLQKKLAAFS